MQTKKWILGEADVVSRCRAVTRPGSYSLVPRANRVMHDLPALVNAQAQVLAAPPHSSFYVAHELVLRADGGSRHDIRESLEQFLYVLEGVVDITADGSTHRLDVGGYCWLPPDLPYRFATADGATARAFWIRRKYLRHPDIRVPDPIIRNEKDVPAVPSETNLAQELIPIDELGHDMACNLLTFEPGEYFAYVESHIMEHALYMLSGRGVYWLAGDFLEVQTDDFIHMAAYCPQFMYATGWERTRYLVYKDINRDYDWAL